jgi:predicted RNA-binding Zn ribbon-like protein
MELPPWVPADETKPAPMPLLVVQSFVNTWEADSGVDLLTEEGPARRWLRDAGLLEDGRGDVDLATARQLREGIRALLVHNAGGDAPDAATTAALGALTERCRLRPTVHPGGGIELWADGSGGLGAVGRLLLIVRDAQRDGTWGRLKACRNPDCHWAFYDRSHAGRGAWCDMAVCGNRIKNRNLRSRRSGVSGAGPAAGRGHDGRAGQRAGSP